MLGSIRGTATRTGLKVTAVLDEARYRRGQKVPQEQAPAPRRPRHEVCPRWNNTLSRRVAPAVAVGR
jgi:hypothetical protein